MLVWRGISRVPTLFVLLLFVHGGFQLKTSKEWSRLEKLGRSQPLHSEAKLGCFCAEGTIACGDICYCVDEQKVCDGKVDCPNGQDEQRCVKPLCPGRFACNNGRCIASELTCDGINDCGDKSDEIMCSKDWQFNCSRPNQFNCTNDGYCIPFSWQCDGQPDCLDQSDEKDCAFKTTCQPQEFQCKKSKKCIWLTFRCDGEDECDDGSDEIDCSLEKSTIKPCSKDEFSCETFGRCIAQKYVCNGEDDCGDWSDETECGNRTTCAPDTFRCHSGKCIESGWVCDGSFDCNGHEDEANCTSAEKESCPEGTMFCDQRCISSTMKCDGKQDCYDETDELDCDDKETCKEGLFSCPSGECLQMDQVCNGQQDCFDGKDETDCVITNCSKLKCSYACQRKNNIESCLCTKGFSLSSDNQTCIDINECMLFYPCSQRCHNMNGSFNCSCVFGYQLRQDKMSCKAKAPPARLIFATRKDIREVNLNGQEYPPLASDLDNAISVDFYYRRGLIYWTDISIKAILRAYTNGLGKTEIVRWGLQNPCGLAVDWYNDHIYWVDSQTRRVEVAGLDGSNRRPLIWTKLQKPRGIITYPAKSMIIWTDWGMDSRIERAYMDGSGRSIIIEDRIYWPNGITIDYPTETLYWVDAKQHVIESANLDGTQRRKITRHKVPHPFYITVFEDKLYWTDWKTSSVHSIDKRNGKDADIVVSGVTFPMGIKSMHPERQPLMSLGLTRKGCAWENGGCSHLCLPNTNSYGCFCPHGLYLLRNRRTCSNEPDLLLIFSQENYLRMISLQRELGESDVYPGYTRIGNSGGEESPRMDNVLPVDSIRIAMALDFDDRNDMIYWTDMGTKTINRAHLNGSRQQVIVRTNLEAPGGLALDWINNKIYWTDDGTNKIEVSNLDGSIRAILIWSGLKNHRCIAVHPKRGYMFWSQWGEFAMIERASMDGTDRKVIVSSNLNWANGLSIDYDTGFLFWSDAKLNKIETSDLDGNKRRIIIDTGIHHPFGLALYGNYIFWSDWKSRSISMSNKLDGGERKKLLEGIDGLMNVIVFHKRKKNETVENPCASRNGGCSHLCLLRPNGFSCACPTGLLLQNDKKKCHTSPDEWLVFAQITKVRSLSLDTPYIADVILQLPTLHNVVSLDIDYATGDILLPDGKAARILKCSMDGFNCLEIITSSIANVEGIAIEQSSRKIYWTDIDRHSVEVSELDGSNRRVLFVDLDRPRAIITHFQSGRLFWTDWDKTYPRIEVADLDGHNRKLFVTKDILWPNGLAIDNELRELYWTDAKRQCIEAIGLDGRKRRTVISGKDVKHPYGVAVSSDWIYWTDWEAKALLRVAKDGNSEIQRLRSSLAGLMDIKALPGPKVTENVCGDTNGNCSHLCLRNPQGFSCTCPTGITLQDGRNCASLPTKYLIFLSENLFRRISLDTTPLWDVGLDIPGTIKLVSVDFHYKRQSLFFTDIETNEIRSVPLGNSSLPEVIAISSLSTPNGIAVDWIADNIYWTDQNRKEIEVARLNGSSQKNIIQTDLSQPRALAVFPQKGYLFWTDWGNESKIERSSLDGTDRVNLFMGDVGWPNGLAIDYKKERIYWTDAERRTLESSDLDGSNRALFLEDLQYPFGLTVIGNEIFWTDWEGKCVASKAINSKKEIKIIVDGLKNPMEITAVGPNMQEGTNPCGNRNGGCTHLCLYRSNGEVICACPDIPYTQTYLCSEEPIIMSAKDQNSDKNSSGDGTFTIVVLSVLVVVLLGVVTIISVICVRSKREKESVEGSKSSCSTLTYTNPTYAASHSDVNSERKPFAWRRIHHDKPQSRRFEEAALISEGSSIEHESPTPTPSQRSACFEEVQV